MALIEALGLVWVFVGSPGNPCDPQVQGCFGAVQQAYWIQRTEVTNAEYVEFLNAVAVTDDPAGLWNPNMSDPTKCYGPTIPVCGGIERAGGPGAWSYAAIPGHEEFPVNFISWYDALRYANWLHNGQPVGPQSSATTELGAYDLSVAQPTRLSGARVFLPSEDEWYKAAYFDGGQYHLMPARSDVFLPSPPASVPDTGNCDEILDQLSNAGAYTASEGPNGTFDQGGNVYELTETAEAGRPVTRGGSWGKFCYLAGADRRTTLPATTEVLSYGFRVAAPLPEPEGFWPGIMLVAVLRRRK